MVNKNTYDGFGSEGVTTRRRCVYTVNNKRLHQENKKVECSIYIFNLSKGLSQQYTIHSTFLLKG